MKTIKTALITTGICAALVFLLFGCGKAFAGEKKEPVTLVIKTPPITVFNGGRSGVLESYQLLEKAGAEFAAQYEKADVTVKVVKYNYMDEEEYIENCFGTEQAVDLLFSRYFTSYSYIYRGHVVPLDDILTPELKDDFVERDFTMGQVNGKTYLIPYFSLHNTLCYNKKLFRQCGLERFVSDEPKIQNWTLQEWDEILQTLAKNLPAMHYPMLMYAKSSRGDSHIMTLLRSHGSSFFDERKKLHLNTEEGIAALSWIQEGYAKGYFPSGCENMTFTDCVELFNNGQLAISATDNAMYLEEDQKNIGLVNFPSADGNGISTLFVTGFQVFDNGDDRKIQAAKDFLRFFYQNEKYLAYERVAIPSNQSVTERFREQICQYDIYKTNGDTIVSITEHNPNWQGSDSVRSRFRRHIYALLRGKETAAEAARGIDRDCNAIIDEATITLHE